MAELLIVLGFFAFCWLGSLAVDPIERRIRDHYEENR